METNIEVDIAGSNAITFGKRIIPILMPKTHENILFHTLFICSLVHPIVVFRLETVKTYSLI